MAPGGFLAGGFLAGGFLSGESGKTLICHRICQLNGFIGGRILGEPRHFCVEIIQYATGAEGWKIVFYDKDDKTLKLGELSSDIGNAAVNSLTFDWAKTGCGDFDLSFGVDPATLSFTIEYNQGIEIYLYHDSNPWYAGYITEMPVSGSTARPWRIKGAGYFNQLETCVVDQNFTTQEVSDIVRDLMTEFIEDKTDIIYADHKISETEYTAADIRFDHVSAKKAVSQLKDLAQSFVVGVDENRELFFWGTSHLVNPRALYTAGKNIDGFDPKEDAEKVINRVYVKAGLLDGAPKSNIQATVTDFNSQILYGLREKVMTAPTIRDADDAERWGRWQLEDNKYPKKKAKIKWADCSTGLLKPEGKARILGVDGSVHEMPIEKITYTVGNGIGCSVSLGDIEPDMGTVLRDLLFSIANEELLQQANMSQL